jgi:hypothetical protein
MRALREGEYAHTAEIARRFGLSEPHVRRLLRFACVAPDILQAIFEGRQPCFLTVRLLLKTGIDRIVELSLSKGVLGWLAIEAHFRNLSISDLTEKLITAGLEEPVGLTAGGLHSMPNEGALSAG